MSINFVEVKGIKIGKNQPLVLIAGPCVIESEEIAMQHARAIKEITEDLKIPFIFKASYDKANRSSISSFRGPGIKKGLRILRKIREDLNVPVLSDVHCVSEVDSAAEVLDVIQIPAFLSRQTNLILKAADTGRVINVKKGQFMSPYEMNNVVTKIESKGNKNILLTERGTTFGYNMLINDFRAILMLAETGYPVVYDATHSVQMPGGNILSSGGESKYVLPLSRAAVAVGCDALFVEVHREPEKALSDGPNMLKLSELRDYLVQVKRIREAG
ncbi:MAG: 3-deoxy-8-phosphooctulonate synthase [Candidatus Omnitrophota bacterium]|nr:3-deoxy-8-phosphooctulonate synthase [Candidatus Omnitrophota bacterium]MBU1894955.1 3-deoxy-8-phosphooctulonate synthase [Candidatus Omnitrophota bacterium]